MALMNDLNPELVNFWMCLSLSPSDLHRMVTALPNNAETYYELRSISPGSLSDMDRASRFFYLNRYSFNGLYRTNAKGEYNVPYGGRRCGAVPGLQSFQACARVLASARFFNVDFEQFVRRNVELGDFVYLDPPYVMRASRVSAGYGPGAFSAVDFQRLAKLLVDLDEAGILFLLSYTPEEYAMDALAPYYKGEYVVQRRISGFRHGRGLAGEVVFSNCRQ